MRMNIGCWSFQGAFGFSAVICTANSPACYEPHFHACIVQCRIVRLSDMSPVKIKRSIWLPLEVDTLVQAERSRLQELEPLVLVSYSDALRSLLTRNDDLPLGKWDYYS